MKLLPASSDVTGTNDTCFYSYLYACFHQHTCTVHLRKELFTGNCVSLTFSIGSGRRHQSAVDAFTRARWQMWQFSGMIHRGTPRALHVSLVQTVQNLQRPFHFCVRDARFHGTRRGRGAPRCNSLQVGQLKSAGGDDVKRSCVFLFVLSLFCAAGWAVGHVGLRGDGAT